MTDPIEKILQQPWVWRGRGQSVATPSLVTGHRELDEQLSEGWPIGAMTELLITASGCGEISLLLPALRRLENAGGRIAWVAPPYLPYPPALRQQGLERIMVVRAEQPDDGLWATEQMLRSGACAAVLCWPRTLDERRFRRLQLAAEAGRCWGVAFRAARHRGSRSPAALRLAVDARGEWQHITILKRRGTPPPSPIQLPRSAGSALQ